MKSNRIRSKYKVRHTIQEKDVRDIEDTGKRTAMRNRESEDS